MSDIENLKRQILAAVAQAKDEAALEWLRVAALGKKGSVSELLKSLGTMSLEERKVQGPLINGLRDEIGETIAARKRVQFDTDEGKLLIELFYESAPSHVANFLELTRSGFYSGKTFHRLEPGYLIQGGCPRGDGTGIRFDGKRIAAELNPNRHQKGSISMALLENDPDSASCQFFISYTREKDWDGRYTVFGQLIGDESFDTLDRLMAVPVDDQSRPARTLFIRSARAMDAPTQPPRSVP